MIEASRVTSFAHLLADEPGNDAIRRVEIPLIQRDYAQGRDDVATRGIRTAFLEVLHSAVTHDSSDGVGLDFVYGDVDSDDGALRPLDGQQRLTTLFLLHWYVAHRTSVDLSSEPWTAFSYATRASARLFCERIVAWPPPTDCDDPTAWIRNQSWFQYVWRHDPTIQSMLRMITAIHERFADDDLEAVWQRLTDHHAPAISFHLLPIHDMGSPEDLYIKMNSRGKPLTEFENFKARFETVIHPIDPSGEVAHKIDGSWADLFWKYRGDDDLIDDELLRYMRFLIEICEWKQGEFSVAPLETRVRSLFGLENPAAGAHLRYVIRAFDTWIGDEPEAYFSALFIPAREEGQTSGRVPLFLGEGRTNLFESCVTTYGDLRGSTRSFSFGQQLLLAAVLAYRSVHAGDVDDTLKRRIRIVRNLIDASENEIRLDRMPALLKEVENIVLNGLTGDSTSFNRAQFDDELAKADFLLRRPDLSTTVFALEDHVLLRGALGSFELDPETLPHRADAFSRTFGSRTNWTAITGALLAAGPYARPRDRGGRSFQFGVGEHGAEVAWRTVLGVGSRDALSATRAALMAMLDAVAPDADVQAALSASRHSALAGYEAEGRFDWRYYLIKYDSMREGRSGIYFGRNGALGYSLCMLKKSQLNSHYRDPYLLAIWRESGVGSRVLDPWFSGYESNERWLVLRRSGARMRSARGGLVLSDPNDDNFATLFGQVSAEFGVNDELLRTVGEGDDAERVDTHDRVQVGAALLRALVDAGL